ncbi:MAG TPA: hypothetical protein VJP59_00235 [Gemmatimonadota bacterium]|nr:hypothetical protein [Gemmatimonadota bacterium]
MSVSEREEQLRLNLESLQRHEGWKAFSDEAARRMASAGQKALHSETIDDRKRADAALIYHTISRLMDWPAREIEAILSKENREA